METALERIPVAGDAMVKVLQGGKQLIRRGIYNPRCLRRWASSTSGR